MDYVLSTFISKGVILTIIWMKMMTTINQNKYKNI